MLEVMKFLLMGMLCFCFAIPPQVFLTPIDSSSHLDKFSNFNITEHDNIDDSIDEHTHRHKHSEDGEEHEHNHDHFKMSQHQAKVLNQSGHTLVANCGLKSTQTFFEKHLISGPHLLEVFRPPIA